MNGPDYLPFAPRWQAPAALCKLFQEMEQGAEGMDSEKTKEEVLREARELIEEHRADCLWFLRDDLCPTDPADLSRLLKKIEAHADVATFIKARRLREWLSRNSSGTSAGS